MVQVTVVNNVKRTTKISPVDATLKSVLDEAGIDYATGSGVIYLDGSALMPGDINKTFADFGITKSCYLAKIVKADNAGTR